MNQYYPGEYRECVDVFKAEIYDNNVLTDGKPTKAISVNVYLSPDRQATAHQFIFRSPWYSLNAYIQNKTLPKNLGFKLHSFIAWYFKQLYPEYQYIVSNPLLKMAEMMIQHGFEFLSPVDRARYNNCWGIDSRYPVMFKDLDEDPDFLTIWNSI